LQLPDENRTQASEQEKRRHRQRPRPRTQRRHDRDRERDEAQSPDRHENREDPGVRRAAPTQLAYELTSRRVMRFEGTGGYPPADEHDLCEDRSPREQPRPTTHRIGQKRPSCRPEPKRDVT
jgi:hypothetical protein